MNVRSLDRATLVYKEPKSYPDFSLCCDFFLQNGILSEWSLARRRNTPDQTTYRLPFLCRPRATMLYGSSKEPYTPL
jgi:hypothetical protein